MSARRHSSLIGSGNLLRQGFRNGGPGLANDQGKLFVSIVVFFHHAPQGFSFFNGFQIFSLEILNQRDLHRIAFGDHSRDFFKASHLGGPVTSLASN